LPGSRSCSLTVRIAVSITGLRLRRLIRFGPITSRSSEVGWISTTPAPFARSFFASLPSRRPDSVRVAAAMRSAGFHASVGCSDEVGFRQITRSSCSLRRMSTLEVDHMPPST
jgi:hypothetical protein